MVPQPAASPEREVGVVVELDVHDPTELVAAVAVAAGQPTSSERLAVELDGAPVPVAELQDAHGSRLHLGAIGAGRLRISYDARATGRAPEAAVTALDRVLFTRPSRYVQSDALVGVARETFGAAAGVELVRAVESWVHEHLEYRPEATSPTGGAVETLDTGAGVCRDYAHLVAAFLRALDVPARVVSVYAPRLAPMDFHAIVEAVVDDRWVVVDATRLAPRRGMLRIATGRDTADVAFVTTTGADVDLVRLDVHARDDEGTDAVDDPAELVTLG